MSIFDRIRRALQFAEANFLDDSSDWGLGLTYNLVGRIYSIRGNEDEVEENFSLAKKYYKKAVEHFTKCEHNRGIYLSM